MDVKRSDTSKKNRSKKAGKGKKLTAAERRRIERKKRSENGGSYSEFDEGSGSQSLDTLSNELDSFGGMPLFGVPDDYYSLDFTERSESDAPDDEDVKEEPKRSGRPDPEIKPASELTPKQRKIRRILSYISVFLVIVIFAVVLSLTVMFRTTDIVVEANGAPYTNEQIIETSGLSMGENIFMAKRKAAVKNLVDTYPYIEAAEVTFRIPGTQIIKITAAKPSYQVQFSGGYAVVSENSRILEIDKKQKNNIPLLKGLKLNETKPGEYINFEKSSTKQILDEVVKNINDNEVSNIYGIDISNAANISLNYDNRITILLGLPEDVGYKLRTAKAIIHQKLSATDAGTLDVSLANSDRRSSYFTPIYSDTVSLPDTVSTAPKSDRDANDNEFIDDIID